MIPISSAVSGGLVWSNLPRRRGYELKRMGETLGSLIRTSVWSQSFRAESAHGQWIFRPTGFWRTSTEVVDAASNQQIAILKTNLCGGGTLTFSDGQTFRLAFRGWWRPLWFVDTEAGQRVLSIQSREKTVELSRESSVPQDRLTLLMMLAWHCMKQAEEQAASSAAVVAAIS